MTDHPPILPAVPFGNTFYWYFMQSRSVVIDTGEHYPKQTWRNRYDILAANGPMSLTIPVIGLKGEKVPVRDVLIDNSQDWMGQHLKTLISAYASAPFFEHYQWDLEKLFGRKKKFLLDFSLHSLELQQHWLSLKPVISLTEKFQTPEKGQPDLRGYFKPSKFKKLEIEMAPYPQVFSDRHAFVPNCSSLDLVFNLGPEARMVLAQTKVKAHQIAILGQ